MKVQYETMTPPEIRAARESKPVAYLPLGTLEWHGLHLPVGNDALKAHALCCEFARRIGGLVFPPIYWGDDRGRIAEVVFDPDHFGHLKRDHTEEMMDFYGLVKHDFDREAERSRKGGGWKLFERVLDHSLHQIDSFGFEVIVTVAGHYPLNGPAKRVAGSYSGNSKIMPIIGYDLVEDQGYRGDHAARWETSLLLALRPQLVSMDKLDVEEELVGVMGEDPKDASVEYGREAIEAMVKTARSEIEKLLAS